MSTRKSENPVTQELESIRDAFVPARLRMARELKGMSQASLANDIVSAAAVSQYERGGAIPSPQVLSQLADRLEVRPRFFTGDDQETDVPAFFRSLRSAPAGERKKARHFVQLVRQIGDVLEEEVRLPPVDVPTSPVLDPAAGPELPAAAARMVRAKWQLSPGPVPDVVRLVERHGVIVARLATGHERIDAFSVPFSRRPVIMMSAAKNKRDRSRLDVAHELGHLVMHPPGHRATKQVEDQAQQFAAEFLMPAHEIADELPSAADWHQLLALKQKWHVSIAALLYRARALEVMAPDTYVGAMKALSARGWRKHEPGDLGPPESPLLLRKAIDAAGISDEELAARLNIPLRMLRQVLEATTDDRPVVDL